MLPGGNIYIYHGKEQFVNSEEGKLAIGANATRLKIDFRDSLQGREKWRVKSFNKTKFLKFHLLTW